MKKKIKFLKKESLLMNGIRERVDYMIKLTLNLTKIKANKKSAT